MAADPYEINVILGQTGNYAFVSKAFQQGLEGLERFVNEGGGVNGRPIKFVYSDDQSNPQISLQLFNGLSQRVPLIIGPTGLANCNAVAPLVKDSTLLYCLSPGFRPVSGSNVLVAQVNAAIFVPPMLRYMQTHQWRRAALIVPTDSPGQDFERSIDTALADPLNKDITIVAREHFAPNALSVDAQMAAIKEANPQVVFAFATGAPTATILRALKTDGLDVPVFLSNSNSTYEQMRAYAGFMPREAYFPNQPYNDPDGVTDKGIKAALVPYLREMSAMHIVPDTQGTAWDVGLIVTTALKRTGLNASALQLRDAISKIRDFPGVTGRYDFTSVPQRGLDARSIVIQRWNADTTKWVTVSKPSGSLR